MFCFHFFVIKNYNGELLKKPLVIYVVVNNTDSVLGEYINEDGELALAYETQKTINKQLELELQDEKAKYKAHEREYKFEIEKLKEDNERQQRILSANLTSKDQSQNEIYMQHEIARLTAENLDLHDTKDTLSKSVQKLKKQLKQLMKKLKETGFDVDSTITVENDNNNKIVPKHNRALPSIKKKDREYLGMFSYPEGQENIIMKHLVIGKYVLCIRSILITSDYSCRS